MENQKRSLSAQKVIEDLKAGRIKLSEEEAEKYIDQIYFFIRASSEALFSLKTCNPLKISSIEPKMPENISYNIFPKKFLVNKY